MGSGADAARSEPGTDRRPRSSRPVSRASRRWRHRPRLDRRRDAGVLHVADPSSGDPRFAWLSGLSPAASLDRRGAKLPLPCARGLTVFVRNIVEKVRGIQKPESDRTRCSRQTVMRVAASGLQDQPLTDERLRSPPVPAARCGSGTRRVAKRAGVVRGVVMRPELAPPLPGTSGRVAGRWPSRRSWGRVG